MSVTYNLNGEPLMDNHDAALLAEAMRQPGRSQDIVLRAELLSDEKQGEIVMLTRLRRLVEAKFLQEVDKTLTITVKGQIRLENYLNEAARIDEVHTRAVHLQESAA